MPELHKISEWNPHTFDLIEKALSKFALVKFIDQIIEIIVFDSIIGNSDRHQENWAFINEYKRITIEEIPAQIRLQKPKSSPYHGIVIKIIERVVSQFDGTKIAEIVNFIDNPTPESLSHYKLSSERKELIIKMITLRANKLKDLLNERI